MNPVIHFGTLFKIRFGIRNRSVLESPFRRPACWINLELGSLNFRTIYFSNPFSFVCRFLESSVTKNRNIPGLVAAGAAEDPGGGQINGPATEQMYNAGGHRRRAPAVAPGRRGAPESKQSGPGADIIFRAASVPGSLLVMSCVEMVMS